MVLHSELDDAQSPKNEDNGSNRSCYCLMPVSNSLPVALFQHLIMFLLTPKQFLNFSEWTGLCSLLYFFGSSQANPSSYQSFLFTNKCTSDCLKNSIKIYIKTAPTCFSAVTPCSGSTLFVLAKVTHC